ncbi:uncharacterized protein [Drosophila bipectinata]|uniref:uncharacterized protein n=1 Tax=Drosophila bipectinata TaxID=42026 RepID=UPI001C89DFD5|nr:uncharacterized protein LOC108131846 [Drosophila bipectinata]
MGCNWSKSEAYNSSTPNALQAGIPQLRDRNKDRIKEQHSIQKIKNKHNRKTRHEKPLELQSYGKNLAPQLRLMGGSNGSSATECVSALYARTLEQQREEFQRTVEEKTLQQLDGRLHMFLLNQLLLGLQFFAHFEPELAQVDANAKKYNSSDHSLIQSSAIDLAVARNVLYKSGTSKSSLQPLQKPLTYVIFENVDVSGPQDANYDSISALCKVILETDYYRTMPCFSKYSSLMEQTWWKGYVRLKLRDQAGYPRVESPTDSLDEGEIYSKGGSSTYSLTSASSGYSSDVYDHVYLDKLSKLRPFDDLKLTGIDPVTSNQLPPACVRRLADYVPSWPEQSDNEDVSSDQEDEQEEDQSAEQLDEDAEDSPAGYEKVQIHRQCHAEQLQQCYLGSPHFMLYFGELLRQKMGPELGITDSQLRTGKYRGCSVYTSREELVPAIHVPFVPECAFAFGLRDRSQVTNIHTGEQFQWPTKQMRDKIRSMGFHLVPVGYSPKHTLNPFRDLEWKIRFPQAELYLERHCLTPMQLKVFQLMKLLMKTFVEGSCDQSPGDLLEQLRAHLFWQCELYSNDWPGEFLGESLVRFIRTFADCLARKHLRDYFIEERNLFEHIPEYTLMELKRIMSGIAEQPLLHVVHALRNLQHSPDFYPPLDYKRLLENLCSNDYLDLQGWGKFTSSRLLAELENSQELEQEAPSSTPRQVTDAKGFLGLPEHQERPKTKQRRRIQQRQPRPKQNKPQDLDDLDDLLKLAGDYSDYSYSSASISSVASSGYQESLGKPQLNDGLEILRRTNILELLLDHALAMLAKAVHFGNRDHAQLYLEQGQLLCRLYQNLGCSQKSQHFVQELQQGAAKIEAMSETPVLPRGVPVEKRVTFEDTVQIHSPNSPAKIHRSPNPNRESIRQNPEEDLDKIDVIVEDHDPIETDVNEENQERPKIEETQETVLNDSSKNPLNAFLNRFDGDSNLRNKFKKIVLPKTEKLKDFLN